MPLPDPFAKGAAAIPSAVTGNDTMDASCFSLSMTQRLYGFGGCFLLGLVVSFLSTLCITSLNFTGFALLFTIGNVISLASTSFLIGPVRQLKMAFNKVRITATLIYLGSMVMTIISAVVWRSVAITIVFCIIQFFALFWYSASYIPYARALLRRMVGGASAAV
ncbi:MAG: Got1/Sft2-like family-domain-containing protein [Piptocephalis tieghemiana]|nr:MAG: Got1/Sft2-like family-domain-containing protein [Piptocephalis tieghemiana]